MDLAAFDLNLLVAFEAIATERQISRAARKMGLTQPAMSRILRRLREAFGDELFVRSGAAMLPTPFAAEMHRCIEPHIRALATSLSGSAAFNPATSRRRFVIGMADMATSMEMPGVMRRLRAVAPGVDLVIDNTGSLDAVTKLVSGQIELALGVYSRLAPEIEGTTLRELQPVCIGDRANPLLTDEPLTLPAFLDAAHVAVSVNDDYGTQVDDALTGLGVARRVALWTPHFMALPHLVRGSDLLTIFPQAMLPAFVDTAPVAARHLPFSVPALVTRLIWHRRNHDDPGLSWLRALISDVVATSFSED